MNLIFSSKISSISLLIKPIPKQQVYRYTNVKDKRQFQITIIWLSADVNHFLMAVPYLLPMTLIVILPFTLSDLDDGGIESLDGKVRF